MFTTPPPHGTNVSGHSLLTERQRILHQSKLYPGDGGSSIPKLLPKHKHCFPDGAGDEKLGARGRAANLGQQPGFRLDQSMGGPRNLTPGVMLGPAASPPLPQAKTTGVRGWDVP